MEDGGVESQNDKEDKRLEKLVEEGQKKQKPPPTQVNVENVYIQGRQELELAAYYGQEQGESSSAGLPPTIKGGTRHPIPLDTP